MSVVLGEFLILLCGVLVHHIRKWGILAVSCVLEESGKFGEVLLRVAIFNIVLWLYFLISKRIEGALILINDKFEEFRLLWHTISVAIFSIRFIADDIWQVIRLTRGLLVGHVHAVVHFVFGEVRLFMRQFVTFIILVSIIRGLVGFTKVPFRKLPVSFPFA